MQAPAAGSADDLNNAYNNFFVACAQDTNLMKRKKIDQDPGCAKIEKQLKDTLGPEKNNYEVVKLTQSGSDAVMVACLDATKGDISRLLLGQGLYVAGGAMTLRCMSTSGGGTQEGMSESGEDRELFCPGSMQGALHS